MARRRQVGGRDLLVGLPGRAALFTEVDRLLAGVEPGFVTMFEVDDFFCLVDAEGYDAACRYVGDFLTRLSIRSPRGCTVYGLGRGAYALVGAGSTPAWGSPAASSSSKARPVRSSGRWAP